VKAKFNATDYIRVDSRTMHGQEKLGEAVSAGQLIIQLFGRIRSTICLRMQTGNELMLCQLEAQVLEPISVTLFCLNS